jgi:hypothetical protein
LICGGGAFNLLLLLAALTLGMLIFAGAVTAAVGVESKDEKLKSSSAV